MPRFSWQPACSPHCSKHSEKILGAAKVAPFFLSIWRILSAMNKGTCIVAGNAWTLHDDLNRARSVVGDVPVIAVNGAAREVKAVVLFSAHPDRFMERGYEWIRHQKRLFGPDFTVHGATHKPDMPWVEHWWGPLPGGGGSAWGARKVAKLMGFSTVVLCGCPLSPGNYAGDRPGLIMTRPEIVGQYASEIASDTGWHEGCYSMSGATREILGCFR